MKPSVAVASASAAVVQYPQPLTVSVPDFARVSPRHGVAAYASALVLAALTLIGSSFFKEIRRTFEHHVLGVRSLVLWEATFFVLAAIWLLSIALGVLCLSHKGRVRTLGAYSLAVNIASGVLLVCTILF